MVRSLLFSPVLIWACAASVTAFSTPPSLIASPSRALKQSAPFAPSNANWLPMPRYAVKDKDGSQSQDPPGGAQGWNAPGVKSLKNIILGLVVLQLPEFALRIPAYNTCVLEKGRDACSDYLPLFDWLYANGVPGV